MVEWCSSLRRDGIYLVASGGNCWVLLGSAGIWWYLVVSAGICWYLVVSAGIWWYLVVSAELVSAVVSAVVSAELASVGVACNLGMFTHPLWPSSGQPPLVVVVG